MFNANKRLSFIICVYVCSQASALEMLSDAELSSGNLSDLVQNNSVLEKQVKGQTAFYKLVQVPECESDVSQLSDTAQSAYVCDEKSVSDIPNIILSASEWLDNIPNAERPVSYKFNGSQQIILELGLEDNIEFEIGNDGELIYLQDVTLTKNGKKAKIGPITSRIDKSDIDNGESRFGLISDLPLENVTVNIKAIKIARSLESAPHATSLGGLTLGSINGYANSKIFYRSD